jgi:hypothetical protein
MPPSFIFFSLSAVHPDWFDDSLAHPGKNNNEVIVRKMFTCPQMQYGMKEKHKVQADDVKNSKFAARNVAMDADLQGIWISNT